MTGDIGLGLWLIVVAAAISAVSAEWSDADCKHGQALTVLWVVFFSFLMSVMVFLSAMSFLR